MELLLFKYKNWHGDDHEYLVIPDDISVGVTDYDRGELVLNAIFLNRDGDVREDVIERRRTFVVKDISELRKVDV